MPPVVPTISVITVCFNAAHLLKKTIESVLEQTYSGIEYIIVDGASTDQTVEIVNGYGDKINVFVSEPDGGLFEAMNKGIIAAGGELVLFLNAGDFFVTKDAVLFYISKMNLADADLFFGRIVWNDERDNIICLSDHQSSAYTWDLKNSNFPHPATVYKKTLFQLIGLFNLNYPIAADYEWNVRALVKNKIKFQYIDIIVTVFFADGISNNKKFASKHLLEVEEINQLFFKPYSLHEALKQKRTSFIWKILIKLASKYYGLRLSRVY